MERSSPAVIETRASERSLSTIIRVRQWIATSYEVAAERRPLLTAAVLVTVCFALVLAMFTPAFQTNDDAAMCMTASGRGIVFEPDEHLIFTNILIGKLLKSLYQSMPDFPWYGWYLVATQWLATVGILYALLVGRASLARLAGFGLYFLIGGCYFLLNLQFTSTACLAGIAGGMLLLLALRERETATSSKISCCMAGGLLLVWGGLIRAETFPLITLLLLPALMTFIFVQKIKFRAAWLPLAAYVSAAGLFGVAQFAHHAAYDSPEWRSYYSFNKLLGKFVDEQRIAYLPETRQIFAQVGWTENDLVMLRNWYYDDERLYSEANLRTVLDAYPWQEQGLSLRAVLGAWKQILGQRTVLAIGLALPALLLCLNWRSRSWWPIAAAGVSFLGVALWLSILRDVPPERVFVPAAIVPLLLTIWMLPGSWPRITARREAIAARAAMGLLVVGLGLNFYKLVRTSIDHHRDQAQFQQMLADLRSSSSGSQRLVVASGADFPFEFQPPLAASPDPGICFYCLGWTQRTPIAKGMKHHFGITELAAALATRSDVMLAANPESQPRFEEFLRTHQHINTRAVTAKNYGRYALATFQPAANHQNSGSAPEPMSDRIHTVADPSLENAGSRR